MFIVIQEDERGARRPVAATKNERLAEERAEELAEENPGLSYSIEAVEFIAGDKR